MELITLVVVDDHSLLRNGITSLLQRQSHIKVVGEAGDGLEAIEQVRQCAPNVVLMDLKMPRCDGVAATRAIVQDFPHTKVVVLTVSDDDEDILAAVEAGARGYLLKNATLDELLRAVGAAMAGEALLSPSIAAKLISRVSRGERSGRQAAAEPIRPGSRQVDTHVLDQNESRPANAGTTDVSHSAPRREHKQPFGLGVDGVRAIDALTRRELQVLRLLAEGASTQAVAKHLTISPATARHHIDNVVSKLGVHSRLEAVAFALRHNLIG